MGGNSGSSKVYVFKGPRFPEVHLAAAAPKWKVAK